MSRQEVYIVEIWQLGKIRKYKTFAGIKGRMTET